MLGVGVLLVEYLLQNRELHVVHHVVDESHGDEVVLVLLDDFERTERYAFRDVVKLRTELVSELLQLCLAHAALLSLCKLGVESLRLTAEGIYLAVVGVELCVLLRAGERFLLKVGNDRCAVVEECAVFLLGNGESEQCVLLSRTLQRELAVFDDGTVNSGRAIAVYVHYIYLTNTCLAGAFNAILRTRN